MVSTIFRQTTFEKGLERQTFEALAFTTALRDYRTGRYSRPGNDIRRKYVDAAAPTKMLIFLASNCVHFQPISGSPPGNVIAGYRDGRSRMPHALQGYQHLPRAEIVSLRRMWTAGSMTLTTAS
jgi:hypothetical protein